MRQRSDQFCLIVRSSAATRHVDSEWPSDALGRHQAEFEKISVGDFVRFEIVKQKFYPASMSDQQRLPEVLEERRQISGIMLGCQKHCTGIDADSFGLSYFNGMASNGRSVFNVELIQILTAGHLPEADTRVKLFTHHLRVLDVVHAD